MRTQFGVLLFLTLLVVYCDAWFWTWTGTTTLAPSVEHEGSGSSAGSGDLPSENIGAEIIDERHGLQNAAHIWNGPTDAPRLTTPKPTRQLENQRTSERGTAESHSRTRKPGNGTSSLEGMGSGEFDHSGFSGNVLEHGSGLESGSSASASGSGSGFWSESSVPDQVLATSQTVTTTQISHILDATLTPPSEQKPSQTTPFPQTAIDSQTEIGQPPFDAESPKCLFVDIALPFCSSSFGESFAVPNYLNQTSVEEVQVLLNEWAWLLKSNCHHSLEWFFCLLLVPKCGSLAPPLLPCRSFCEVLRDSCWTLLDEGRLPVECHTLPDEEDDGYQCLSVSNQKGNHWFE